MRSLFVLLFAVGACGDSVGAPPDAVAVVQIDDAGVDAAPVTSTPGWLARSATLTFDPALPDGATIELGPGVTVGAITRAGSVSTVEVAIAPDAPLGVRAATITVGGETHVVPDALTIAPSLDAHVTAGAPVRGGLVAVSFASDVPGASPGWWPFSLGGDLDLLPDSPEDFTDGVVLVAPDAKIGPRALAWSERGNPPEYATAPGAITIADRAPLPLGAGDTAVGALAPYETRMYQLDAGSPVIASIHIDSYDAPVVWLFRDGALHAYRSRAFPDAAISLEVPVDVPTDPIDLVAYAQRPWQGSPGYTIHVDLTDAVVYGPEPGDHSTEATAVPMDLCKTDCIISGTIAPGETQVFAVPPRTLLATFPRWTFGLDADLAVGVKVGAAGHESAIPISLSPLRDPYVVDDVFFDQPYYVTFTSTAPTPASYRFSARRYGVN